MGMILGIAAKLLPGILGIVDKAVPDKDMAAQIKASIQQQILAGDLEGMKAAASIVLAEANGSFLQRNWRPMLMILFGVIIANNFLIVPLFNTPSAEIPPDMWDLLKLGVGGYVLGRSAEKAAKNYNSNGD